MRVVNLCNGLYRVHRNLFFMLIFAIVSKDVASDHVDMNRNLTCISAVYIVRMRGYAPLQVLENMLRHILGPFLPEGKSWWFIERKNLATITFPTDFALLHVASGEVELEALKAAEYVVHSVSMQMEHVRATKALHRRQRDDFEENNGDSLVFTAFAKEAFGAGELWNQGVYGTGVRVAVFDTGLGENNPHFPNVVERTDWTEEGTLDDHVGHGTFVAGLIGGSHPRCPGIAPGALLYTFRVFTGAQVSYTSWFLDAFNYAMQVEVDVLNLSIGGPDFADQPFIDKVNELTASGVIVVSAIGNDGPLWGSLNNPADMMEVVGVGAIEPSGAISSFSSRGMTTHELSLPFPSYGRVKPDLVAYGRSLMGPSHLSMSACRRLSGTSVASPVVAGAIALIASTVPRPRRKFVVNPASIKRALLESSRELSGSSIYEQGSGLLDLVAAAGVMKAINDEFTASLARRSTRSFYCEQEFWHKKHTLKSSSCEKASVLSMRLRQQSHRSVPGPQAFAFPRKLDLTRTACPYMWPHCSQLLFPGCAPITLNLTILNPAGVKGVVDAVRWIPGPRGSSLDVAIIRPERFWPWAGGLGLHIAAKVNATEGSTAEGLLRLRVRSVLEMTHSDIEVPIRVEITAAPPREKRLLWDTFHSLRYPPGYIPRDNLAEGRDLLDWLGDHPHTNFHELFRRLHDAGYYVDILDRPLDCLPVDTPERYGGILLIDSEDFFSSREVDTLRKFVLHDGMALIVAAEWYNRDVMNALRFEDDNTRSWWTPVIGGGNAPALNEALEAFGCALGDVVVSGLVRTKRSAFRFESGNAIVRFPEGGELLYVDNLRSYNASVEHHSVRFSTESTPQKVPRLPLLGITKSGLGAIAVLGDTNCLDTAYKSSDCYKFFIDMLSHTIDSCGLEPYSKLLDESVILSKPLRFRSVQYGAVASPLSLAQIEMLAPHSRVLGTYTDSKASSGEAAGSCSTYFSRVEKVSAAFDAMEVKDGVRFPYVQPAAPVGEVKNYYRPHIPHNYARWSVNLFAKGSLNLRSIAAFSSDNEEHVTARKINGKVSSSGATLDHSSLCSSWSAMSGIFFIVLSCILRALTCQKGGMLRVGSKLYYSRRKRANLRSPKLGGSSSCASETCSLSRSGLLSRFQGRR